MTGTETCWRQSSMCRPTGEQRVINRLWCGLLRPLASSSPCCMCWPRPPPCCRQPAQAPQSARFSAGGEGESFDPALLLTPRPSISNLAALSRTPSAVSVSGGGCAAAFGRLQAGPQLSGAAAPASPDLPLFSHNTDLLARWAGRRPRLGAAQHPWLRPHRHRLAGRGDELRQRRPAVAAGGRGLCGCAVCCV
jgi:hypothetical protein